MTKEEREEAQHMRTTDKSLAIYVQLCFNHEIKINDRVFTYGEIQRDLKIKGYIRGSDFNYWLYRLYFKKYANSYQMNLFDKI